MALWSLCCATCTIISLKIAGTGSVEDLAFSRATRFSCSMLLSTWFDGWLYGVDLSTWSFWVDKRPLHWRSWHLQKMRSLVPLRLI
jgi:hypothetical protein